MSNDLTFYVDWPEDEDWPLGSRCSADHSWVDEPTPGIIACEFGHRWQAVTSDTGVLDWEAIP